MRGVYAAVFGRPYGDELVYVGSSLVLERRWAEHERKLRKGVHENPKFQNAYNKYRRFRWEVIEQLPGADEDELVAREQFWYDKYLDELGKTNLLNLMRPEHYPLADPEVRERQRAGIQRKWENPEYRERMSEVSKEKWNDPDFRERQAKATAEVKNTEEWKRRQREGAQRRSQDAEYLERLREGITRRDDTWRQNMLTATLERNAKRWIVETPEGATFRVTNISQFCREHNLSPAHMTAVAQGKRSQHKGYRCWYADEEDDYDEEA